MKVNSAHRGLVRFWEDREPRGYPPGADLQVILADHERLQLQRLRAVSMACSRDRWAALNALCERDAALSARFEAAKRLSDER